MSMIGNIGRIVRSVPGRDTVWDEIHDLKRHVRELQTAQPIAMASRNFDGTLSPATAGTAGWGLTRDGNAIFNDLVLRGEIIGNDALTSPVTASIYNGTTDDQPLTTAGSYLHSGSIAVPAGFTTALVHCTVSVGGTNSSATPDNLWVMAGIGGSFGTASSQGLAIGYGGSAFESFARIITGLSGGTISVSAWGGVDYNDTGWTGGNGHVSATAIFFR